MPPMTDRSIRHRLYCREDLKAGAGIILNAKPLHYLVNVLRLKTGDRVRLFNGRDGEWETAITGRAGKNLTLRTIRRLRAQAAEPGPVLMFAPIKKARLDFLTEKAVELGVSVLIPVITRHTQYAKLNTDRLRARVIEAAEQCERLTVPEVREPEPLLQALSYAPDTLLFADETGEGQPFADMDMTADRSTALLVGPEGGFSADERSRILASDQTVAVDLGPRILRAETAALAGLARLLIK